MGRSHFSLSARLQYKVKLLQGKILKHKGKEAAATSKLWIRHLTFLLSIFLVQIAFLMTLEVPVISVKDFACSSHLQPVARNI